MMMVAVVFLLDVANALLDADRIVDVLLEHLRGEFGIACAQRDWAIFDKLREELGCADHLGDLQRYRIDVEQGSDDEQRLLMMAQFLIDYRFSDRLYARALAVVSQEVVHPR